MYDITERVAEIWKQPPAEVVGQPSGNTNTCPAKCFDGITFIHTITGYLDSQLFPIMAIILRKGFQVHSRCTKTIRIRWGRSRLRCGGVHIGSGRVQRLEGRAWEKETRQNEELEEPSWGTAGVPFVCTLGGESFTVPGIFCKKH